MLAMKKRGFGLGKLNGIGGKVQENETIEEAAIRELEEEVGVVSEIEHLESAGDIKFYFKDTPEWNQHMHIFFIRNWEGEPEESDEMAPQWHKHSEIPFEKMWVDDRHWLPLALGGKRIEAEFYFGPGGETLDNFEIKEI